MNHPEVLAAWAEYIQHRVELKAPLTTIGSKRALIKVEELAMGNPRRAVAIINQSLESGWLGIFPLKPENEQRFLARERALTKETQTPFELLPSPCNDCGVVFPNRAAWADHSCQASVPEVKGDPVKLLAEKFRSPLRN